VELKSFGRFSAATVDKVTAALSKDLAHAAEKLKPTRDAFTEGPGELFHVWGDRSSEFLSHAVHAARDWLTQIRGKLGHTYLAGELTAGGTFECMACGKRVVLLETAHVPVCPKCGKKEFRRLRT